MSKSKYLFFKQKKNISIQLNDICIEEKKETKYRLTKCDGKL